MPLLAYRAKLGMLNTMSKIRGQVKATGYPQTEGLLGDCMIRYGRELGDESMFGELCISSAKISDKVLCKVLLTDITCVAGHCR